MGVNSIRLDDELYCQVGKELRVSDMSTRASQGFGLSTRLTEVVFSRAGKDQKDQRKKQG